VASGIHTFSADEARMRMADGWQFIAINSELRMLMDGAKRTLDGLGIQKAGDMVKY
jgi:4-hydroxy-2-oxoheptanedioate aldolase